MPDNNHNKYINKINFLTKCSALGITRVVLGFPFEHPIDSIRV